jgi:hypothetical protein
MYARTSEFFGDIQHQTSVECSLRQLLQLAAQQQQQGLPTDTSAAGEAGVAAPAAGAAAGGSIDTCSPNLYLAQQSLQDPGTTLHIHKSTQHCMPSYWGAAKDAKAAEVFPLPAGA